MGVGKLPAIQFYPADWRKDSGVQTLDFHDRGVWFEMLCLMHESEERGKLVLNGRAMTHEEVAKLLGLDVAKFKQTLQQILSKGVASVEQNTGTIYNRRMVSDDNLRRVRTEAGSAGGKQRASKRLASAYQKSTPSSSTSSSTSLSSSASATIAPPDGGFQRAIFDDVRKHHPAGGDDLATAWAAWGRIFPVPEQGVAERMKAVLQAKYPPGSEAWGEGRKFLGRESWPKAIDGKFWLDNPHPVTGGANGQPKSSRYFAQADDDRDAYAALDRKLGITKS